MITHSPAVPMWMKRAMLTRKPQLVGTLAGFTVVVAANLFFSLLSADERLELQAYKQRVRWCNSVDASPSIVHVDIDDSSLERMGRWPWHRDRLADIIRILKELGAGYILVDLLLSEPEDIYLDDPGLLDHSGLGRDVHFVGSISERNKVYGDLELADAIRSAGNVILAVQLTTWSPNHPDGLADRILGRKQEGKSLAAGDVIRALRLKDTPEVRRFVRMECLRLRIRDDLLCDFTLAPADLAVRLAVAVADIDAVLAGVKRRVARELVDEFFAPGSIPKLIDVLASILGTNQHRRNADTKDIEDAYLNRRACYALHRKLPASDPDTLPLLHRVDEIVPPDHRFSEAAEDIGAVTFTHDADGSVLRVPLVIDYEGKSIEHFGFSAAAHILNLDVEHLRMPDHRTLVIPRRSGGGPLEIPIDGQGCLLIPWTRTGPDWRRGADFPHIPIAKIWELVDTRHRIEQNQVLSDYLLADVVAASKGEFRVLANGDAPGPAQPIRADHTYRRKVNTYLGLDHRLHLARLTGDRTPEELESTAGRSLALRAEIEQEQRLAVSAVRSACKEFEEIPRAQIEVDPSLKRDARRFHEALRLIENDITELENTNRDLAAVAEKLKQILSRHVTGKYVFIGYAATGQGDIVATPIDDETNGVMCHANILNAFLQNRFITRAPRWIEIGVCLLLGALISFVTATRGPHFALITTLGLILAYTLFNGFVLFLRWDLWLAFVPVVITMLLVWASVTLFRQLTAERDRRLFRRQLSQYTSPAIAAKIAESPEAAQAFKAVQTRDMTCFFSDLHGFTSITETEDAELVQQVLNIYFEHMSRAIWDHHGLINKFMGDGIMAFFNPSVDPLPDHARVACETALATLEQLERLKHDQADTPAGHIFGQLKMRVGLAAGPCKNGDMGSELKADYTVIGDVVNLAARLEPANKVFGTRIMVSGPVRDRVKDDYEFRYLAELQVKGKKQTVPAYEIVGRRGKPTEEVRDYIRRFEAGVELYKQRRWDDCIVHFTRILARRPDDLGAGRYIDACQELKTFPPDDAWNGALELKEK